MIRFCLGSLPRPHIGPDLSRMSDNRNTRALRSAQNVNMDKDQPNLPPPENNLRRLRTLNGLTQKNLCDISKISPATIRGIETRKRTVSAVLKYRVVNALNRHLKSEYKFRDVFPNDIDE